MSLKALEEGKSTLAVKKAQKRARGSHTVAALSDKFYYLDPKTGEIQQGDRKAAANQQNMGDPTFEIYGAKAFLTAYRHKKGALGRKTTASGSMTVSEILTFSSSKVRFLCDLISPASLPRKGIVAPSVVWVACCKESIIIYPSSHSFVLSFQTLAQPITKLDDVVMVDKALNAWKLLQTFLKGSRSKTGGRESVVRHLTGLGINHLPLRDELYMQLVKQLNRPRGPGDPDEELTRAWTLMKFYVSSFAPSTLLYKHLVSYFAFKSQVFLAPTGLVLLGHGGRFSAHPQLRCCDPAPRHSIPIT